jgi:DHA1 family inner membrane transport protein
MTRNDIKSIASGTGGYLTAMLSTMLAPVMVPSLRATFGLSPAAVGAVIAVDAGACAATAIFLGLIASRRQLSYKRIGTIGVLTVVVANFLFSMSSSFAPILFLRAIVGIGEGAALTAAMATLGALPRPEKKIALVLCCASIISSVAIVLTTVLHVAGDARQMFAYLGGITLVAGMGVALLPKVDIKATGRTSQKARGSRTLLVLVGGVLLGISASMVWAFAAMVGSQAGLGLPAIAAVVSVAGYCAIVGSGLAGFLGTRFGSIRPAAMAVILECFALFILVVTRRVEAFAIGMCTILLVGMFIRPYFMGIVSMLDRSGGLAATMSGGFRLGGFVGPVLGGISIQFSDNPRIVVMIQILLLPMILLLFWNLGRTRNETLSQASVNDFEHADAAALCHPPVNRRS